jgi:hypothetical protein
MTETFGTRLISEVLYVMYYSERSGYRRFHIIHLPENIAKGLSTSKSSTEGLRSNVKVGSRHLSYFDSS